MLDGKAAWWQSCFMPSRSVCCRIQSSSLPWNYYNKTTVAESPELCDICHHYYCSSCWFKCESAVDAPWNDLNLYSNYWHMRTWILCLPEVHFKGLTGTYLTAEMVPLALFSGAVSKDEKQAFADRLLVVRPEKAKEKLCGPTVVVMALGLENLT